VVVLKWHLPPSRRLPTPDDPRADLGELGGIRERRPLGGRSSQDDARMCLAGQVANRTGKASDFAARAPIGPMAGSFLTRYDALS
jgi:hypothetical protein